MIKGKCRLIKDGNESNKESLDAIVDKLKDGDYDVLIFDNATNRRLPQLKYLCGVVLKEISDSLPEHPEIDALFKFFEEQFATEHFCILPNKTKFYYYNLKHESAIDLDNITNKIIQYATDEWGIKVHTKDDMTSSEAKAPYAEAYTDQWNLYFSQKPKNK